MEAWESWRSRRGRRRRTGEVERRQEEGWQAPEAAGTGLGLDTYHGHMASLPPGFWDRSRASRQEVDTAKELRGSREGRGRGTGAGKEREKTQSEMAADAEGDGRTEPEVPPWSFPGLDPADAPDSQRPRYLEEH